MWLFSSLIIKSSNWKPPWTWVTRKFIVEIFLVLNKFFRIIIPKWPQFNLGQSKLHTWKDIGVDKEIPNKTIKSWNSRMDGIEIISKRSPSYFGIITITVDWCQFGYGIFLLVGQNYLCLVLLLVQKYFGATLIVLD
jgi:hypothetical protein